MRGFLSPRFEDWRDDLRRSFLRIGYKVDWRLYNASDFGVPQLRPRVAIVAGRPDYWNRFRFPVASDHTAPTVGETLYDLMAVNGWPHADKWASDANRIAPTIVGGSKKHGGPDLGPTRARAMWKDLGVNGGSIAEAAPLPNHDGMPRLTTRMVARLQGFPDSWAFSGKKTATYRQIGNAFPPPFAKALGTALATAIRAADVSAVAAE